MKSFLLEAFNVNGKNGDKNISGLIGLMPLGVEQKEAVKQIKTWCENVTLRRTTEGAEKFLQERCNNVFESGVEVKTQEAQVVMEGEKG